MSLFTGFVNQMEAIFLPWVVLARTKKRLHETEIDLDEAVALADLHHAYLYDYQHPPKGADGKFLAFNRDRHLLQGQLA